MLNNEGYEVIENLASKDNIEDEIIENEEKLSLYAGINKLSKKEKEVIVWFYFENRTLEEYARQKGICYRAAVERKRIALKKLRYHMFTYHVTFYKKQGIY
jgi:DNA-directed RNA polymerase specialized sigma subunit